MTDRKQTPDVLGEMLGGDVSENITERVARELAAVGEPKEPGETGRRPPRTRRDPQPQRRRTGTTKKVAWEYLLVSFQEHKGWRPRYLNGQELSGWMDAPVIHDYVGQLGEEGWELVGASAGQRMYGLTDLRQLYFKRHKS